MCRFLDKWGYLGCKIFINHSCSNTLHEEQINVKPKKQNKDDFYRKDAKKNHYLKEIRGDLLRNSAKGYPVLTYKTLIKCFKSTFTYLNAVAEVKSEVESNLNEKLTSMQGRCNLQIVK